MKFLVSEKHNLCINLENIVGISKTGDEGNYGIQIILGAGNNPTIFGSGMEHEVDDEFQKIIGLIPEEYILSTD